MIKMKSLRRVVLIDDDEAICFLHQCVVEELAIASRIDRIHDGGKALQYIDENYSFDTDQRSEKDLIILNMQSSSLDGAQVLNEIQQRTDLDRSRFVLVLLTSSGNGQNAWTSGQPQQAAHYSFTKPLTETELLKIVVELEN
jgi:CheY-like chemotaxis protein